MILLEFLDITWLVFGHDPLLRSVYQISLLRLSKTGASSLSRWVPFVDIVFMSVYQTQANFCFLLFSSIFVGGAGGADLLSWQSFAFSSLHHHPILLLISETYLRQADKSSPHIRNASRRNRIFSGLGGGSGLV